MSVQHTDVAAYSFGLLEQQDRLEFEAHLAECETCRAELAELSAMSSLFAGVDPVEPEAGDPGAAQVEDLMLRRAAARRRTGRQRAFLAAAASVVLLGGGVAAGVALAPQQGLPPVLAMQGQKHTAVNAATGVRGTVGLVDFAWGTQVILDLGGVHGPLTCELVAVSRSGQRRVIAGWQVPAAGYGVPGHPAHLLLAGGTSIMRSDLARVDVDVVGGRRLLSIRI
ncbi:MAG TPA: zf-HC2 domain-containing protein [Streptosporangiaceae bacterium]